MEKFYLEVPTLERKKSAIEYMNEFYLSNSYIAGDGGLNNYLKEKSYEEWVEKNSKMQDEEYASSLGLVPACTYFCVRESDNKIVGMFDLRYKLNDYLENFGGHIGYAIRPSERGKGYAKIQLYLGLLKVQELGIDEVLLIAKENNIGSNKTITSFGGVLENRVSKEDAMLNRYWLDVNKSLKDNKDKFEDFIGSKKLNKNK